MPQHLQRRCGRGAVRAGAGRPRRAARARRGLALWMLMCGLAAQACAADGASALPLDGLAPVPVSPGTTGLRYAFDIPAQPLAAALKRYATQTRQPTLFRSEIVAGQTSSAVLGLYAPDEALRMLLHGTGLVAERVDGAPAGAYVLKALDAQAATPRASLESLAGDAAYPGLVQARVWDALCRNALTAPGAYRSLLRFQLDAAGRVQRVRLLGSSGDGQRDAALLETLRRVRVERAPPPDMPQPVTLLILPRDSGTKDEAQPCGRQTP
ncbi:TonB family protein [Cupriavidus basilensis]